MDHGRFWDTLSRQLQNRGPDYVARCNFRNKPLSTGDNVVLPASFPQLPVKEVQEIVPLVKACEEDMKNVSHPTYYHASPTPHIDISVT